MKKLKTYKIFESVSELNVLIDNIHDYAIDIVDDELNVSSKIVGNGIRVHIKNSVIVNPGYINKYESFRFQKYLLNISSIIEYIQHEEYSIKVTLVGCQKYGGAPSKNIDISGEDFIKAVKGKDLEYVQGFGNIDLDLVFVDSIFINIKKN